MARVKLQEVEFPRGAIFHLRGPDGELRRTPVSVLTTDHGVPIAVDEELGIIYAGPRRFSIHSQKIGSWVVLGAGSK